ncbi:MAG: zf-HC2 domain-containing protein [Acidobacteria bacterium]|nr:zf-HC2 domain-containing protein [Acidobacteriota bacterium]
MKHIEFERLVEKFERRLSDQENGEIDAHIAECSDCGIKSAKLADFFAYSDIKDLERVPQAVTAGILNIYQRRPVRTDIAVPQTGGHDFLIFDDWQMAVNERYSGLDTRQMLYRFKGYDIDLRIELISDQCRLTGQLFPESIGATAEISSNQTQTTTLNKFGEFAFDLVPQGVYDFRISVGKEDLWIEKVPLQN